MCRRPEQKGARRQALGRSRGGFTTKIHAKSDASGDIIAFDLTGGEAFDGRHFETLLDIGPDIQPRAIICDKGYASKANRDAARARSIAPVIPHKANEKNKPAFFSRTPYKARARIEQGVGRLSELIGVTDAYIRHLSLSGEGPDAEKSARGRRQFTLDQIHDPRRTLARSKPSYLPERRDAEHLQVIAVTNFKGGSGRTTTAAHLAQYFAMRGYRTLAIDLDPQASLFALFGLQPEFYLKDNDTILWRDPLRRPATPTHRYHPAHLFSPAWSMTLASGDWRLRIRPS